MINRLRIPAVLLSALLLLFAGTQKVFAREKNVTLRQAKSLALEESREYESIKNKLELSQIQYAESVKTIELKKKNQSTFRWTPLLNFKFPEKPDLSDEFEYTYKPLELQSKIDDLKHQKSDCIYGIYEKVSGMFADVYTLQETIAYEQGKRDSLIQGLAKNRARLALGMANQADIDSMEKKKKRLDTSLAAHMRSFENGKEKLSDLTGLDLSVNYRFANPFVRAGIDRKNLEAITEWTLEHDHAYYLARKAAANGLLALNTNYDLMKNQYGGKMGYIDSFVNQARRGEKLDSAAFRIQYDALLKAVDSPWQGKKRILFVRVPKVWFKGATDGVRYVEDEPYVLYEAALEYQGLYAEEQSMKKELAGEVRDSFENYMTAENAWISIQDGRKEKQEELRRAGILNRLGEMTYEEYAQVQEEYEDLQQQELDALASYSQILYSFDRLTCGAVSRLMSGASAELETAEDGKSYVVAQEEDGVYYYIHSLVQDNVFELGITVPDDFEIGITDYELWVNGQLVGERTPAQKTVRHLAFALGHVDRAFIRLYDGDAFLDDCDIDALSWSGRLSVVTDYRIERTEDTLAASYRLEPDAGTGLMELNVTPEPSEPIAFYNLKTADGHYLLYGKQVKITEPFRYLPAVQTGLEELIICFYDEDGQLLYEGEFRTADMTIHKK